MDDLTKLAGSPRTVIINGREYQVHPLTIGDLAALQKYKKENNLDDNDLDMLIYNIYLAMKKNDGITKEFVESLPMNVCLELLNIINEISSSPLQEKAQTA